VRQLSVHSSDGTSESSTTEEQSEDNHPSSSDSPTTDDLYASDPEIDHSALDSPGVDDGVAIRSRRPDEELVAALERLSLNSLRLQMTKKLPFLLRNLRQGFEYRCRLVGVPTRSVSRPDVSVNVVYECEVGGNEGIPHVRTHEARMRNWRCPLCELHGALETREMLEKHLQWDHPEVQISWQNDSGVS
jgi:hypothetical protein